MTDKRGNGARALVLTLKSFSAILFKKKGKTFSGFRKYQFFFFRMGYVSKSDQQDVNMSENKYLAFDGKFTFPSVRTGVCVL